MRGEQERVDTRCLRDRELQRAYAIKTQYLDDAPFDEWVGVRRRYPDLFVACLRQGELIGIAYGRPADATKAYCEEGSATLHGIAIVEEFVGKGYGSQLLRFFDRQVERAGYEAVGVGSAGGYVDHFYMKNGYDLVAFMIRLPSDSPCPPDLWAKHAVVAERFEGNQRKLYVNVSSLDNGLRDRLLRDCSAVEVVAIMNKKLGDHAVSDRDNGN